MSYNSNKSLYWYGWRASFKQGIGKAIIIIGIIFGLIFAIASWIFGLIFFIMCLILGIWLLAAGSSQRFDYQRQSGSIIHGGDNFR